MPTNLVRDEAVQEEGYKIEVNSRQDVSIVDQPVLGGGVDAGPTQYGYDPLTDTFVEEILTKNLKGEHCAIGVYQKLLQITKDADPIIYNTVLSIQTDDVEHEEDLQSRLLSRKQLG